MTPRIQTLFFIFMKATYGKIIGKKYIFLLPQTTAEGACPAGSTVIVLEVPIMVDGMILNGQLASIIRIVTHS